MCLEIAVAGVGVLTNKLRTLGLDTLRDAFVNREHIKRHVSVIPLAVLCLAGQRQTGNPAGAQTGDRIMPSYSPELIQTMRAALDEVMTKIPLDQATPAIKAHMAEFILKAAAEGQTSYDGLLAAASDNIQAILSVLT
jgi:hypothetical protein